MKLTKKSALCLVSLALVVPGCQKPTMPASVSVSSSSSATLLPVTPVVPTLTPTVKSYRVTFLDSDGEKLAEVKVEEGKEAHFPDGKPSNKCSDTTYYTFSHWNQDVSSVKEDMIVKAVYTAVDISTDFTFGANLNGSYTLLSYQGTATEVVVPDTYNYHAVTGISASAFKNLTFLTSVTLPETVEAIGDMAFLGDTSLTKVNLPRALQGIGNQVFALDNLLGDVVFPEGLLTIGSQAFYGCESLTKIELPDSLVSLGSQAFFGDINVATLHLGKSLTFLDGGTFVGLLKTSTVDVSSANPYFTYDGTGLYYHLNLTEENSAGSLVHYYFNGLVYVPAAHQALRSYTIASGTETLAQYAFSYTTGIQKVIVPSSVTLDQGFAYLESAVKDVEYPLDGNVFFYDGIFSKARKLTHFTLPSSLHVIPTWSFEETDSLRELNLSDSIVAFEKEAFIKSGIIEITLPKELRYLADPRDQTSEAITATFSGCPNLTTVIFPEDCKVTEIPDYCFVSCTALKHVVLPSSVTSIGKAAFQATGLTDFVVPKTVKNVANEVFSGDSKLANLTLEAGTPLTSLPFRFCWGCPSLASLVIPEGIKTISGQCFFNDTALKTLSLPVSLKTVQAYAIAYSKGDGYACLPFTDIYYAGTEAQFAAISIAANNGFSTTLTGLTMHYVA